MTTITTVLVRVLAWSVLNMGSSLGQVKPKDIWNWYLLRLC